MLEEHKNQTTKSINTMKHFTAILLTICFFSSCKTYTIPVESFRERFMSEPAQKTIVTTQSPWGGKSNYETFKMDSILCLNKSGDSIYIENKPSLEIRFTMTNNKRHSFYFDNMTFEGNKITGGNSRILSGLRKTINIDSVKKIELQYDGKQYNYVK
jgi:hypothetical protein